MKKIIGISSAHDSSACLFENGKVKYFVKEERLSGKKRDKFPVLGISSIDTDGEEVSLAYSAPSPEYDYANYLIRISNKFHKIKKSIDYSDNHHLIHANLSFYNSGFNEALVVVVDRNGTIYGDSCAESETIFLASYPNNFYPIYKNFWIYNNSAHEFADLFKKHNPYCDVDCSSMYGIVKTYETATSLIRQDALENGKTMGLSAYGDKDLIFHNLFIKDNIANDYYFGHEQIGENRSATNRFLQHLSVESVPENDFKIYADYAWQVQKQTQEAVASLIGRYVEKTGVKNVCIAGGYGLNVVANHYYITQFPDVNFFFEPIPDDSGNSIGAAMKLYRDETLDTNVYPLDHIFFNGKKHSLDNIVGDKITIKEVAKLLSENKSVAVYQGLAEAGPRALGNRSILFDARDKDAKEKVNKIKKREWYRPFAGMVLEEDAQIYFNTGKIKQSEFMTISFPVTNKALNEIPGIIHVDETCRIQTVNKTNPIIYDLIKEFKDITGVGVLLNTSFNLAGKPLVETPQDAIETLNFSNLDYVWFPELGTIVKNINL
jgi:carbamoyltransferase